MSDHTRSKSVAMTAALVALTVLTALPAVVAAAADHLLIQEIVMRERPGVPSYGSEYVKVLNPTDAPIDLSDVYLTDALYTDVGYWQIVLGGGEGSSADAKDWHARFPDGLVLGAGESLTISLTGSTAFQTSYGFAPDLELFEDSFSGPDNVAEMRAAFPGAIGYGFGSGGPTSAPEDGLLHDDGESLVLYTWDGEDDLVVDLDYVLFGSDNIYRVDKSGVSIDGPDDGVTTSDYQDDTAFASQSALTRHTFGDALSRLDDDETGETQAGGNGFGGDDETSEPLTVTWSNTADQTPGSTGTAPAPAPIISSATLSPEEPFDGEPTVVTAEVASFDTVTGVTCWYSTDAGDTWTDLAMASSRDAWTVTLPAMVEDDAVIWYVEAATAAASTVHPAAAPFYAGSFTVIAPPPPPPAVARLLLTEVAVAGNEHEFVEIYNPTEETVSLEHYYLTDAIYSVGSQFYWRITAGGANQSSIGGGAFSDFHARFPADAEIPPGEVVTVSLRDGDAFAGSFGAQPDFELFESGAADDTPDMLEVFSGSVTIGDPPYDSFLSNGGEVLILYWWDGESPTVTDVDIFRWYAGSTSYAGQTFFARPEQYSDSYQPDTPIAVQQTLDLEKDAGVGSSYQRVDVREGAELRLGDDLGDGVTYAGGNGPSGEDETSEDLLNTWAVAQPTPGEYVVPTFTETAFLTIPAATFLPDWGETLPIGFSTPDGSETVVRILDLEGRVVRHVWDSRFDGAGADKTWRWDGRDDLYELVKAGTYIVHMQAVDLTTGERSEATAPAVVATRLSR